MAERVKIMIASDDSHERVFAEVYVDGKFVALVSQEQSEEWVVELPGLGLEESLICRTLGLEILLEAFERAVERLRQ